jgi:hypothetical protein
MIKLPAVPPKPAAQVTRNLDVRLGAERCGKLLAEIPWAGQPLDPALIDARTMLGWLR